MLPDFKHSCKTGSREGRSGEDMEGNFEVLGLQRTLLGAKMASRGPLPALSPCPARFNSLNGREGGVAGETQRPHRTPPDASSLRGMSPGRSSWLGFRTALQVGTGPLQA